MPSIRDAVIVAARRSAVGRGIKGSLRNTRPDDLAAQVIRSTLASLPDLPKEEVDDVALGCAMPEAEQGLNVARVVALRAGLPNTTSGITLNRFCSSGLRAIATVAERVMVGAVECSIAGGLESMSLVPMGGHKAMFDPKVVAEHPEIYISMGLTAENVARKFEVSRADQDAFALESHTRAVAAIAAGAFKDEIVTVKTAEGRDFSVDEGPRPDTDLKTLARLPAVFHARGSVTPGNSSPLSDGVAAAVVMSASRAKELGLKPLARFVGFASVGVAPEIVGFGLVVASPEGRKQAGLSLVDSDLCVLN